MPALRHTAPLLALAVGSLLFAARGLDPTPRVPAPFAWRTVPSQSFEGWLLDGGAAAWVAREPDSIAGLSTALSEDPRTATRAALVLAHSGHPESSEILLARLEQRILHQVRPDDGGDCAAAAALGRLPLSAAQTDRLVALSQDPDPHPDLEVRTECAIAALARDRREVVPFLIRVLRIDTPSEQREGPLTDSPTTAWARGRATAALSELAGLPYVEKTDASLAEREALADRFATELLDGSGG